jgi:TolB-like protein/Flp pilus assembly protein TadD/predicted Ser/Thr protein kinase
MIGTTVSHYRILEHLGGGGMGVVYKAEDLKLERTVALKFLPPEWSRDPDARERFLREARAASTLDHPHICNIHEIDETEEGRLFIVMAFYEGETLKKRIERGPLPIADAVDFAIHAAEGLAKAHEQGITHRDIKPANLLITGEGELKIVDFGLAKLAGEQGLTRTGSTVGTPHYMSPEQALSQEIGPDTDIWSLGVVLYEMVSGVRPFRGESGDAVVHSILHDRPPRLRDLRSDTPAMLERIITRTLERDPDKRYATAEDLLTDLKALEAAESETGLRTTTMGAAPGKRRRVIGVLGIALVVVFAVVMTWVLREQSKTAAGPDRPPRVVVLPFENLGPPEDEYFADGLTSEIISRLAVVSGLEVISRTTAMNYKGTGKSMSQIGDELGVDYALEGEVRWERASEGGGRVRITPQLIRVAADAHVWSERYERPMKGVFALQSEIAQRVIEQLEVTLLEPEREAVEKRPTDNMDAYNAYLRGLSYSVSIIPAEIGQAIEMFERAVALDPGFALAYASLSMSQSAAHYIGAGPTPHEFVAQAKRAADRAIELEKDLPEGHKALGFFFDRCESDYQRALEQYAIAAGFRPNDAELYLLIAVVHSGQGRWQEAAAGLERAVELDPQNYGSLWALAMNHSMMRKHHEAANIIARAIALAPDRGTAYVIRSLIYIRWRGFSPQSRRVLEEAPSTISGLERLWIIQELSERNYEAVLERLAGSDDPVITTPISYEPKSLLECICYQAMGQQERARVTCEAARVFLEGMLTKRPDDPLIRSALGSTYASLGRKEEAIREGERAVALLPMSKSAADGPHRLNPTRRWTGSTTCCQSRAR